MFQEPFPLINLKCNVKEMLHVNLWTLQSPLPLFTTTNKQ